MTTLAPNCPDCGNALNLGPHGERLDAWRCPQGHGLGFTLSEGYEHAQEDELARLWQLARAAGRGPRTSPFGGAMVEVTVGLDDDEAAEGAEGDTPDTAAVTLDVDVDNQFIWFDVGELDVLPRDRPDPKPSAQELAQITRIADAFGDQLEDDWSRRDGKGLTNRMYAAVARHPGLLRFMHRSGGGIIDATTPGVD